MPIQTATRIQVLRHVTTTPATRDGSARLDLLRPPILILRNRLERMPVRTYMRVADDDCLLATNDIPDDYTCTYIVCRA